MAVSLVVIGASHRTAPLWFLEALSLDAPAAGKLADSLVGGAHISEAVVLSTCNRTELYLAAETFHGAYGEARNAIADVTFLGPESFADHMIVLHDEDAVRHLLEVTAGLDSVVVGEHEIIGQVRSAWTAATERGTAGSTLGLLFRHAIEAASAPGPTPPSPAVQRRFPTPQLIWPHRISVGRSPGGAHWWSAPERWQPAPCRPSPAAAPR